MKSLPSSWRQLPFELVARYETGRTPARAHASYWKPSEDGVPWVAISDMENYGEIALTQERISRQAFDEVFRQRITPAGTLLMSFKLTIGRVAELSVPACHNEAIISIFPNEGIDQRFLKYYLSQVDFTDHQDRQVKGNTLNQAKIDRIPVLVPPLEEQRRIAEVLDSVRSILRLERNQEELTADLKRAAMRELFMRGLRGEPQKQTEIGPVPESWEVASLGSLGKIGNGSTPKKNMTAYWDGGTFPWLTSAKVYDRNIREANQFVTQAALRECHLPIVQPGAILIAITGQGKTLGNCAVLEVEATINQHIAYLQTNLDDAVPSFVRGYLESRYDYLRQVASGGGSTKGALTCAFLKSMPIPLPAEKDEQLEIASILDAIDRKLDLHKQKRAVLEELFKTLLHKLMTGEVRVEELDLSALGAETSA